MTLLISAHFPDANISSWLHEQKNSAKHPSKAMLYQAKYNNGLGHKKTFDFCNAIFMPMRSRYEVITFVWKCLFSITLISLEIFVCQFCSYHHTCTTVMDQSQCETMWKQVTWLNLPIFNVEWRFAIGVPPMFAML